MAQSDRGPREIVCPRLINNEGQATQYEAPLDAVENCM